MNTLRQVGTATGVAVFGALYASRVTTATLHDLARLPAPPATVHRLAAAVASGAGTRVAAGVPPAARAAVTHTAHAGTASGLNDVLLAAAAYATLAAIVGFAYGRPSQAAAARPRPRGTVGPVDAATPRHLRGPSAHTASFVRLSRQRRACARKGDGQMTARNVVPTNQRRPL